MIGKVIEMIFCNIISLFNINEDIVSIKRLMTYPIIDKVIEMVIVLNK